MAAIAFDTLKCAQRLINAGVPQEQAEAEVMAEAFIYNTDSLVTKDFLDEKLDKFVTKDYLDARLDALQAHQDAKFDERLSLFETHVGQRMSKFDLQFARMDGKFMQMFWMLSLIVVTTVVPAILNLLS